MTNKIDYKREALIMDLLYYYLDTKDFRCLHCLYRIIEQKLKLILMRPLHMYKGKILAQKQWRLLAAQAKAYENSICPIRKKTVNKESAYVSFKERKKININYNDFWDFCRRDYLIHIAGKPTWSKGCLLTSCWETISKLTREDVECSFNKNLTTYETFLLTRFADFYWKYIETKLKEFQNAGKLIIYNQKLIPLDKADSTTPLSNKDYMNNMASFEYYNSNVESTAIYKIQLQYFKNYILTPRQREILNLLSQGYNSFEIAQQLGIKDSTVRNTYQTILTKLTEYFKSITKIA